jgi:ATP adenylyltransferase
MARKSPPRSRVPPVKSPRAKPPIDNGTPANGARLWAPWRYQYIRTAGAKSVSCIFCFGKLDADERKRRLVVYESDDAVVMLNRYPYNNGHLMVAPRRHVASPELLTREERGIIAELVSECCVQLRKALNPSGLNVGANLGRSAGAGIADHMHCHIVPRWDGDTNFMPVLASTRVLSQDLESSFEMLAPLFKTIRAQLT